MDTDSKIEQAPTGNDTRYDRQLRLWAASGQTALECANILILGAGATATQTLKNLILPGVGSVTILDDSLVTTADVGKNFFLHPDSIGKPAAQQTLEHLLELNENVKGTAITQSFQEWFNSSPNPLEPYNLVININRPVHDTNCIVEACWKSSIPLILVQTCGFFSYIRAQYPELTIIETHPQTFHDLRLDDPFPELQEFVNSINLDSLDSYEHTHVPAVVLILKAIQKWSSENENAMPLEYKQKSQVRQLIRDFLRFKNDENIEEAANMFFTKYRQTSIPSQITKLFQDEACTNITTLSTPFWIHVRALRDFVYSEPEYNKKQLLPLTGSIPDMKATSDTYSKLKRLYHDRAKSDLRVFRRHLENAAQLAGISKDQLDSLPGLSIDDSAIFVKHSAFLEVLRTSKLLVGQPPSSDNDHQSWTKALSKQNIQCDLFDDDNPGDLEEAPETPTPPTSQTSILFGLIIRDQFLAKHGRSPALPNDVSSLNALAKIFMAQLGYDQVPLTLKHTLQEIARAQDSELPPTSAWIGGIVAQEAIKLITKQYVPLNGTLIINGITSRSQIFT